MIMVAVYMYYTYLATEWRIEIRRKMNDSDSDANTKAIDSLLNYETVKYFSAEEREGRRYDRAMTRYEDASVEAYTSLAVLNAGQAVVFTCGLVVTMVLCVYGIRAGTHTVGDFVMINAIMIQLYQPLNFMGMVYREIKQALVDIEIMFSILEREPEIKDKPGAEPLLVKRGTIRFENVSFAYEPGRQILKGVSFEVPAGHRSFRRRQIDHLAAAVSLLRGQRRAHIHRWSGYPRRHATFVAGGDRDRAGGPRPFLLNTP